MTSTPLQEPARGSRGATAFAIRMRQLDRRVDLVECDPGWRVYGAGISITGPTFRAFERLGLLKDLRAKGFFADSGARIHRGDGALVAELPMSPIEPGLPTAGGIMRPDLHEVLSSRARSLEVDVRLGVTASGWTDHGAHVTATFTDGSMRDYSVVVGADGIFSKTRAALFLSVIAKIEGGPITKIEGRSAAKVATAVAW